MFKRGDKVIARYAFKDVPARFITYTLGSEDKIALVQFDEDFTLHNLRIYLIKSAFEKPVKHHPLTNFFQK